MVTPLLDALREKVPGIICQALDASEDFGNAVTYAYNQFTGLNLNPPNFATIAKGFVCPMPSPVLPPGTSRPQGGQCECIEYYVSGYATRNPISGGTILSFNNLRVWGPLGAISTVPGGFIEPFVTSYNIDCGGLATGPCSSTLVPVGLAGSSDGSLTSCVITSIRRVDGLPDNCGNPSPIIPTPLPDIGIYLPDIQFQFKPNINLSTPITVNAQVLVFQPRINFNGQLIVPITFDTDIQLGPINFKVDANFNLNTGDINFNFNGGNNTKAPGVDSPCDEPTEPVRNPPPKPPGVPDKPDDPDIEEVDRIVAVLVTANGVPTSVRATQIAQGDNPTIFAPNIGFVNFYCQDESGSAGGWTPDIPVKNQRCFIVCPYDQGAVGVAGTPQAGVSWSLTPIRRKIRKGQPQA